MHPESIWILSGEDWKRNKRSKLRVKVLVDENVLDGMARIPGSRRMGGWN
jgi:hypothetical protein